MNTKTSRRSENTALVDITLNGRPVATLVPADQADARQAKLDAYAAAGMQIIRDASDMPRVARMRHINRVAIVDADGQIVAHYASIDEAPAIEAPAESVEAPSSTSAPFVASIAQEVADFTAETRHGGYILTDGGATQIFDHS